MPNFTQYGDQDYVFGFDDPDAEAIADSVGMYPQTLSVTGEPEFTAEAKNLEGMTAAVVVADKKFQFTMTGFVIDPTKLDAGGSFEYKGRFYILMGNKLDVSNVDFQKGEVNGSSYVLIES